MSHVKYQLTSEQILYGRSMPQMASIAAIGMTFLHISSLTYMLVCPDNTVSTSNMSRLTLVITSPTYLLKEPGTRWQMGWPKPA
eukprot:2626959-Karenia_brevis.AAC.1